MPFYFEVFIQVAGVEQPEAAHFVLWKVIIINAPFTPARSLQNHSGGQKPLTCHRRSNHPVFGFL